MSAARWDDLTIDLPLPPSNNDLVRPGLVGPKWRRKCRLVSTKVAKLFRKDAVAALKKFAEEHDHPALLHGPVLISAVWFLPSLSSDCNNRWKALEDAITESGVVWDDDKQVSRGVADKDFARPGAKPSCRVRIETRASHEHARRLAAAQLRGGGVSPARRTIRMTPNWRPAP